MMEAHEIGIRLAMTSNHAQVFQALTQGLLGVHTKVDQLNTVFSKLGMAIGGAFALVTGGAILRGLDEIMRKAGELSHEMTQIEKLGGSADARAARENSLKIIENVRGITQTEAARIYGQTYGILGSGNSLEVQQLLAQYAVATGNTTGRGVQVDQTRALVRAAEQMGRLTDSSTHNVDLNKFRHFVDIASKITAATEGQVGAQELYQLTQQAGPAMSTMDDQGIETMAVLSQYMGAPRAGTAMMSLKNQFAGGKMWKRNAVELERLGILKPGEYKPGGGGGIMLSPDARKRLGMGLNDPLAFITQTLVPALEAHGYTSTDDQINEIYTLFGRQTSQREIADILRNRSQIGGELGRLEAGQGLDEQLKSANMHDVTQNLNNLSAAFTNFFTALGGPNSENYINILQKLTSGLEAATKWANEHPDATKKIVEGLAAVGVGLVALGAVFLTASVVAAIGALGTGGALIVGIGAFATAIGTLIALNWDAVSKGITQFAESIKTLWEKIKSFFTGGGVNPGNVPDPRSPGAPGYMPMGYNPDTGTPYLIPASYSPNYPGGFGLQSGGGYVMSVPGASGPSYSNYSGVPNYGANPMGSPGPVGVESLGGGFHTNLMHGQYGGVGQNLTTVDAGGHRFQVNAASAPYFQGFVSDLIAAGAPIHAVGGYRNTYIAGTHHISQHAFGNAIDIDQGGRNLSPRLRAWASANPEKFRTILHKWGMVSGGDWSNPDFGHFEWGGPGGHPSRYTTGDIARAVAGHESFGMDGPVDRSRFAGLINNPAFVARMASMAKGEVGLNANIKTQMAIAEEAFNRWDTRDQPAGKDLYHGPGGYYAANTFQPVSAAEVERFKENVLKPVLAGSNILKGMTGNASNDYRHGNLVALHQFNKGTPGLWLDLKTGDVVNLPAGYGGGRAEAFFMEKGSAWHHPVTMRHDSPAARFTTNSNWNMGLSGTPAVPPHKDKEVHIHAPVHLDGRQIASNTMRHMVNAGNSQPHGGRLPDYTGTRPIAV